MGSTLRIPPVALADLEAFRARHFHDVSEPTISAEDISAEATYEDGDGLGYYPDGVKRTLTDEQIAMFRHSEIYALLRERQVQKENKDAEFSEDPEDVDFKETAVTTAPAVLNEGMGNFSESDDEEEYAAFLAAEQKQIHNEAGYKKRKRSIEDSQHKRDKVRSTRRVTREMDEAGADETVLDYREDNLEDASSVAKARQLEEFDELNGRKRMKYDDVEDSSTPTGKPAGEGRKIWWPTIGG